MVSARMLAGMVGSATTASAQHDRRRTEMPEPFAVWRAVTELDAALNVSDPALRLQNQLHHNTFQLSDSAFVNNINSVRQQQSIHDKRSPPNIAVNCPENREGYSG
jgi:hypothetical protein